MLKATNKRERERHDPFLLKEASAYSLFQQKKMGWVKRLKNCEVYEYNDDVFM